jgi:hypothetical protein
LYNPQTLNKYVYAVDRPTSVVDPTGLDSCSLWDWNTWGGCANNVVNTVNNVVIRPAETFVNNNVVTPLVNNVVKPFVKSVIVPLVKSVIIPLAIDYIAANNYVGSGLDQTGNFLYNDIQSEAKIIHDLSNSPNRLVKGLVNCGIIVGIGAAVAVGFVYGGPP